MEDKILLQYKKLGVKPKVLNLINDKLKLPNERLTVFARPRRLEALQEAIDWKKGPNQQNRIVTKLYSIDTYSIGVAKPGKEAAPNYKGCRHYITGKKTNNPNDMYPLVLKSGEKIGKNLTFEDMFEKIEELMRADLFGLELMGMFIFRAAFMLDHEKNKKGKWRYCPPEIIVDFLEKSIPSISEFPTRVYLHFLEILSLNEDVKVYTLGYSDCRRDYGRINTLLTFANLITVLLNRRPLFKFAGSLARPPSGMSPLPKTKATEYFPLLSPDWEQTALKFN